VQTRSFEVLKSGGVLVSSVSPPNSAEAARRGVRAEFILVDVSSAALAQIANRIDAGMLNTHVGPVLPLAEGDSVTGISEATVGAAFKGRDFMSLRDPNVANPNHKKKIAIVIANSAVSTTTGWSVGFWWSELTHSSYVFDEAG
jgi:hypothetical protein